jgi:hypothetical protein
MSNSTKTLDRFIGTVKDWNTGGYSDHYYDNPIHHTNCAADEGCSKNPHYAGKCLSIFYADISFFIYDLNQQSEFTFYKLMLWESSSGELSLR